MAAIQTATLERPVPVAADDRSATTVDIPVLYTHDEQSDTWCYLVHRPAILGGGYASRREAEISALRAVSLALSTHAPVAGPRQVVGYLHADIRLRGV